MLDSKRHRSTLAAERINLLIQEMQQLSNSDLTRLNRLSQIAWSLKLRHNVRIKGRVRFCRECHMIQIPGRTVRVRLSNWPRSLISTCLVCGTMQRKLFSQSKPK